jgi:hypothetical protein
MFDIVFKKFKEELEKDYPDYAFYITDDLEAEDFVINSVICEINGITVKNAKEYSAMLNFYIIKPKVQDDLGNFILQALDIQKKIQNLDENKRIFFSEKMSLQFGELKSVEAKETLRICLITGTFDTSFPIKYAIDNMKDYSPAKNIYLSKRSDE